MVGSPIDPMWVVTTLLALVGVLFGVLIALLGWMGNKVYSKISEMASTMHTIEADLHGKIGALDRRVTRVETHVFDGRKPCDAGPQNF